LTKNRQELLDNLIAFVNKTTSTEDFMQWLKDNPSEVNGIVQEKLEMLPRDPSQISFFKTLIRILLDGQGEYLKVD
jgi:Mg2+/Co2+ transporter CorB